MKKRILIPYATYGSGHKAIAEYIKTYFESTGKYECMTLDLIQYSIPIVGYLSKKSCETLMTKFPSIWSLIYFSFDNKLTTYITSNLSVKLFDNKKLKKAVQEFNPDITIATHFFGTDLAAKYNKNGLINSKIVTVVTDYKAHEFWLKSLKGIDAIVVGSMQEKVNLLRKGFKSKKIHTTGIPISPQMKQNLDKEKIKKKLKINNNNKTVLFFVGGGNGAILNLIYFKEILKNNYDCNVIFVAGRNKKAEEKAKKYVRRYKSKNVHILGFVSNVNELYYISDFVVTKPGGAQVTECLLFECPMLLIKSNGGQEIENRRYLVKKMYAKSAFSRVSFNTNFKELLTNDKLIAKMRKNIKALEKSKSMDNLYKIVEKL